MALGELDRIVESLVNRGLISPKMVGRQVGQATINELQNLGSSLGTSNAIHANNSIKNTNQLKQQILNNSTTNLGKASNMKIDENLIVPLQLGTHLR